MTLELHRMIQRFGMQMLIKEITVKNAISMVLTTVHGVRVLLDA